MKQTVKADYDPSILIMADEEYPVIGDLFSEKQMNDFYHKMIDFHREAQCLEKSRLLQALLLPITTLLLMGEIEVFDADGRSSFAHYFNLPYEFHAWLEPIGAGAIIDISLPGVIMRGRKFEDDEGFILQNREPVFLAGPPPSWIVYRPKALFFEGHVVNLRSLGGGGK